MTVGVSKINKISYPGKPNCFELYFAQIFWIFPRFSKFHPDFHKFAWIYRILPRFCHFVPDFQILPTFLVSAKILNILQKNQNFLQIFKFCPDSPNSSYIISPRFSEFCPDSIFSQIFRFSLKFSEFCPYFYNFIHIY